MSGPRLDQPVAPRLDVACGKGAAAIALAIKLGVEVVGELLAPEAEVCAPTVRDLDGLEARAEARAMRRPDLRGALNLWLGGTGEAGAAPRDDAPAGRVGAAAGRAVRPA